MPLAYTLTARGRQALTRKFGVEFEFSGIDQRTAVAAIVAAGIPCAFEGYTHRVTAGWKIVTDATCGLEAVSPILEGTDGLEQVAKVAAALEGAGAQVDRRCGFHVHVDARDLTIEQVKNVARLYAKMEPTLDKLVAPSRRQGNTWCKPMVGTSLENFMRRVNRVQGTTTRELGYAFQDRYFKLNLASLLRHGTVEFRQHQGTLNGEKAVAWVCLCLGMVRHAARPRQITARNADVMGEKLLKKVTTGFGGLFAYFQGRMAELGAPDAVR